MIIKKTMISREIAGDTVLVPFGDTMKENNGLFLLTETGSFIWNVLPNCENADEVVEKLLEEYDVSEEQAKKDVEAFLEELRSFDIID